MWAKFLIKQQNFLIIKKWEQKGGEGGLCNTVKNSHQVFVVNDVEAAHPASVFLLVMDQLIQTFPEYHQLVRVEILCKSIHESFFYMFF